MSFDLEEFAGYLKISKSLLDDEIVQQPSLFYEVSSAYVDAVAERDALKEQLTLADAKLDGEVRERAEKDDEKVTEAIVRNRIQTHKKHEAAFAAYMQAKTQADKLQAMKESMASRAYMLRDLVQLHMANYFETSSVKDQRADRMVYQGRRERLAEGRAKRGG